MWAPETLLKIHPLPWKVVEYGDEGHADIGGIVDARGERILHLGIDEQYYPTAGWVKNGILEMMVDLINRKETHEQGDETPLVTS